MTAIEQVEHRGEGGADLPVEKVSFCRICSGGCGTIVSVDAGGRIAAIRGDRENRLSRGYACFKGLQAGESHHGPARLLRPLARRPDGSRHELPLETALDEIGDRLRAIIDEHGPDSVALFCGNGALLHATAFFMQRSFLEAIGSRQFFTTLTIDQSAKLVSFGRLGGWAAGLPDLDQMAVALMFGTNPLVSHSSLGFLTADPTKRLKDAKGRGLKLITVDPRVTETVRYADVVLQPFPGWDPAIAGAIIRVILDESWHDVEFCARFVGEDRLKALHDAVRWFEPEWVETHAGLEAGAIRHVARIFATSDGPACAYGATGPNMAPFSNLAQHLIDCLNVICGSVLREGDKCTQTIVQDPFAPPIAGVIGGDRPWESEPPSRIRGAGGFYDERLSATLAEEILTPGAGRIRVLIVDGGDPAVSLPGHGIAVEALQSLDLLVSIDPWLGPTASLAHFVLPPLLQYERTDVTAQIPGYPLWPGRWAQYTAPVIDPPPHSDLADDWYFFWGLAKRLGRPIRYAGKRMLDMEWCPTTDELIAIQLDGAVADFDTLRTAPHGCEFDLGEIKVQPGDLLGSARFDVMPGDVAAELKAFIAGKTAGKGCEHRFVLAVRRMRDFFNSHGIHNRNVRARNPYNPVFIHPEDMAELSITNGDIVLIQSDSGTVKAVAKEDASMRRRVVALSHGWGASPCSEEDPMLFGSCVNALIAGDKKFESINAMPHMSAVPVTLKRLPEQ